MSSPPHSTAPGSAQKSFSRTAEPPRRPRWLPYFGAFALVFFLVSQATALLVSPAERDMGHLQKIMYVHVPAAWNFMLAYAFAFFASIAYLWKRDERYDRAAAATVEVGVVLTALALSLGSIWGRPTWGVWWTWDPRLTFSAITLLIYVGYLSIRAFTEDEEKRARWCAAIGVLGFINVLVVYMSVRWWRTLHQPQSTPSTVDSAYVLGLRLNAFAFLFLLIFFAASRYYIAKLERATEAELEERALARRPTDV